MAIRTDASAIWVGKQAAKGTKAATMRKRLSLAGGSLAPQSESAMVRMLDGKRFGRYFAFKQRTLVGGELKIWATPEDLAFLESCVLANDSLTEGDGGNPPHLHEMTSEGQSSNWLTFVQRIGTGSEVQRDRFIDCRIVELRITGEASADEPVSVTATVVGLSVETAVASDPDPDDDAVSDPYTWTDIKAKFEIGEDTHRGINQLEIAITTGEEAFFTDDVVARDVIPGEPTIEINGTVLTDADGLKLLRQLNYGSDNPSENDGISPDEFIAPISWAWAYGSGEDEREAAYSLSRVILSTEDYPEASAEGGESLIAFAGIASEDLDGSPALEVAHKNLDDTVY